jgi:pyruvate-formate lyase-activating enzyme
MGPLPAECSALSSEQILNQKSMITLLNLGQSERNQMHDLIAMDLKVFDDKSAFKVIDNDVAMLEQTIDNLKTLQGNIDQEKNGVRVPIGSNKRL